MSSYVFVHGAFHGGWCWQYVADPLRAAGHEVATVDLPPVGGDRTPLGDITGEMLADRVVTALERCAEPAILVGHSMGGLPITGAAELRPDLVRHLVYVTAILLPDGGSCLTALAEHGPGSLGLEDGAIIADEATGSIRLGDGYPRRMFFNECNEEQLNWVEPQLIEPIALAPLLDPVSVTAERFGSVPRSYVLTLRDQAVTPRFQRWMIESSPCDHVDELDTDHSPWVVDPEGLTEILLSVPQRRARATAA